MCDLSELDRRISCSVELGEGSESFTPIMYSKKYDMCIAIYLNTKNRDDFYMKVYNAYQEINATECCRIKAFKAKYKLVGDDTLQLFILNDEQKKNLISMLNEPTEDSDGRLISIWYDMISTFILFSNTKRTRSKLIKILDKMPDYTTLDYDPKDSPKKKESDVIRIREN